MSGLIADSRTMVDKARVDGQNHWFVYNEPMTVESVTQSVSNLAMKFGKYDVDTPMVSGPFAVDEKDTTISTVLSIYIHRVDRSVQLC